MVALSDFESPLITTGNSEIDKKIGGGLPPNSLTLFEGQPDAGKSVLVQQFVWGCLQTNKRVTVYTTENTTVSLLRQMKSLYSYSCKAPIRSARSCWKPNRTRPGAMLSPVRTKPRWWRISTASKCSICPPTGGHPLVKQPTSR